MSLKPIYQVRGDSANEEIDNWKSIISVVYYYVARPSSETSLTKPLLIRSLTPFPLMGAEVPHPHPLFRGERVSVATELKDTI